MSNGAVTAARPLFAALLDDASLFPPGDLPMREAVPAHRNHHKGPHSDLVGRFLCPASRLDELRTVLPGDATLDLGLIMDTGRADQHSALATAHEDGRLVLTAVEARVLPDDDPVAAAHTTVHGFTDIAAMLFVELPLSHGWRDALSLIAARGRGVKLRTGGLVAEAFPSELEVAEFIRASVAEGAQFKCTAGLHNAVRHRDHRTGFEHHGFLNILLATHAALQNSGLAEITEVVGIKDPADIVGVVSDLDERSIAGIRRHFVGFGTCSVHEPIEDLASLGLIEKVAAVDVG
jgi:hypothetical protein